MTMTNQHTDSVLIQQMEILKGDNTMTKTPEPRAWWVNVYPYQSCGPLYTTKENAEADLGQNSLAQTIRVVEQPESDT
jgi:hypothetical protein